MKHKLSEEAQRVIVILKLDASRVFDRVKNRQVEYLSIFSMKRTRAHFPEIFRNKYETIPFKDLTYCTQDVLVALDSFYGKLEDIRWYLNVTEDMPARVTDRMHHHLRELENYFNTLILYLNAELGLETAASSHFLEEEIIEPEPFTFTNIEQSNES